MSKQKSLTYWIRQWNTSLSTSQREFLIRQHGGLYSAFHVFMKAKKSGMISFEMGRA